MNTAPERILYFRRGHALDLFDEFIEISKRQSVKPDHGEIAKNAAIGVYSQREAANDGLLGQDQLVLGRSLLNELAQFCPQNLERLLLLAAPGFHSRDERPFLQ